MPISGLTIVCESINDSVPSTQKLFDAENIEGILDLARSQDEKGAAYIDVNIGRRSPAFMADMVRRIQSVTAKPLSIDTPDLEIAEAGLEAYDQAKSGGKPPILNSISPLRLEMFRLYKIRPFMPILSWCRSGSKMENPWPAGPGRKRTGLPGRCFKPCNSWVTELPTMNSYLTPG